MRNMGAKILNVFETTLHRLFPYVDSPFDGEIGVGKSYFVGKDEYNALKLDIYYADTFVFPLVEKEDIRLASLEEIVAMKFEVIVNGGRKKDFWDIHELLDH
ncbi:hypothetical protein MHTCC0001_15920 [Flavobacteriaceae bacterium MHTCC 0001]